MSTPNRTVLSYLAVIVAAERILGMYSAGFNPLFFSVVVRPAQPHSHNLLLIRCCMAPSPAPPLPPTLRSDPAGT